MIKEEVALKLTELWVNKEDKSPTQHTVLKAYEYFLNNLSKGIDKTK